MLKRILLGFLVLLSLGWILFIGYDIFTTGNDFSASHLFGSEDKKLLVVNRTNETIFERLENFNASPTYGLITKMNDSLIETIYASYHRGHFLIEGKKNWTPENLQLLFANTNWTITLLSDNTFTLNKWKGKFRKSKLYLYLAPYSLNTSPLSHLTIDKKSSVSIIAFGDSNNIVSIKDVYFKSKNKVEYITHNSRLKQGNQVDDGLLFGNVISARIDAYQFFERDYFALKDSVYANGPMRNWLNNGFAVVRLNGEKAIISDYIEGQDPILTLNDIQQTIDTSFFRIPLLNEPDLKNGYHIKYLDDFVVISSKESICDQLIADFKLGNTLAINHAKRNSIFGDLPRKVSERTYAQNLHGSKAVYNGYLLETVLGDQETNAITKTNNPIAMACNFEIEDFCVFEGRGNVAALGKNNEVVGFIDEKEQWRKKVEGKVMGGLQKIDLHGNGSEQLLINTDEGIYLWDKTGKIANGFPIKPDAELTGSVKFYRWKGKSYFLVATTENRVFQFDAQGREINLFKSKVPVTSPIDVWASQNKLFGGFSDGKTFDMYNIDNRSNYRTFQLPPKAISAKIPNELIHFAIEDGQLVRVDQKGNKVKYQKFANGKILQVTKSKSPVVIVKNANELHFINQKGISFGTIRLSFNEVEDIFYFADNSGKTSIAVIDGLENNVYLYNLNGELLLNQTLEGSRKVLLTQSNNTTTTSTIVGQFIVQY